MDFVSGLSSLEKKRGGKTPRDRSGFIEKRWTAPRGDCLECGGRLQIKRHRRRTIQALNQKLVVVACDTGCSNPLCSKIYRPLEESGLAFPDREFGTDVVCLILEKQFQGASLASIHKILTEEYGVRISQTHVGNLFRLGLAMVRAKNLKSDFLREKLGKQSGIILAIDAVSFGETGSAFYVLRDAISAEFLFAQRLETRRAVDLVPLFEKVKELGIPVLGVISDKEAAFLDAAEEVFPEVPHQICQTHYLNNLAKPLESTSATLTRGVRATVQAVRQIELKLLKEEGLESSEAREKERKTALRLCKVVRAGGKVRGDKLLDPTPLKRLGRLKQVTEAIERAMDGKSSQILTKLLVCLSVLENFKEEAVRLAREVGLLREIAHVLKLKLSGKEVQQTLQALLDQVDRDSSQELEIAKDNLVAAKASKKTGEEKAYLLKEAVKAEKTANQWRAFVENMNAVSKRFWKGLFHCYANPLLPSTNNALEAFFGVLKRLSRKATGRRSTSGGPLETCPEVFVEAFTLLRGRSHAEIISMLGDIPQNELQDAISAFEELAEPARERRSIARDPAAELEDILAEWSGTPPPAS